MKNVEAVLGVKLRCYDERGWQNTIVVVATIEEGTVRRGNQRRTAVCFFTRAVG